MASKKGRNRRRRHHWKDGTKDNAYAQDTTTKRPLPKALREEDPWQAFLARSGQ